MSGFTEEFAKFRTPGQIVRDALTTELRSLLAECTEPQRQLFGRMFPAGIDKIPEDGLRSAIDLCQRTVTKNRVGRS
jgi:hypothetical protein